MAGYTIVNMNVPDGSAAGRDGVEARFGRKHLDSEHLGRIMLGDDILDLWWTD